MGSSSYLDTYLHYLQDLGIHLEQEQMLWVKSVIDGTAWQDPQSYFDWNNVAVLSLIEAEQFVDSPTRQVYVDAALEALTGLEDEPICALHLALIQSLLSNSNQAADLIFRTLVHSLHTLRTSSSPLSSALIYLPPDIKNQTALRNILHAKDGSEQVLLLLHEALHHVPQVFYNALGTRFLSICSHLYQGSSSVALKLGIADLLAGKWEGLVHLHRAAQLAPECAPILQTLYLAYRILGRKEASDFWFVRAQEAAQKNLSHQWRWVEQTANSDFAYLAFESTLALAAEPSLGSIVTSVLLAEGDWFEAEMELWRRWIQPGTVVIDVGANVGVYTFSAALRVGTTGRVLAVEPFSQCVRCLEETVRINQLTQVTVCAGAASNCNDTIYLRLNSASELNEVISGEEARSLSPDGVELARCFTLDSLCQQEHLARVDFLKIDAEGHELAVLAGSEQLLKDFAPVILYENIAGSKGGNPEIADYLSNREYDLFRYQPFTRSLIAIETVADFQQQLNIVAIPKSKVATFVGI